MEHIVTYLPVNDVNLKPRSHVLTPISVLMRANI